METKILNGWNKIVGTNVSAWNKQMNFFVNGWNSVVHRFEWLPEMFAGAEKITETNTQNLKEEGAN